MKASFFSRILSLTVVLSLIFSSMLMAGGGKKPGTTQERLAAIVAARKSTLPNVPMIKVMGTSVPENWLYSLPAVLKDMRELEALTLNYEIFPKEKLPPIDNIAKVVAGKIQAFEMLIWEIKARLDGTLGSDQQQLKHTIPGLKEGEERTYYLKTPDPNTQVLTLNMGRNQSAPLIRNPTVFKMAYKRAARFVRDLIFYIVNSRYSDAKLDKNENLFAVHNGSSRSKDFLEAKIQRIAEQLNLPIEFDANLSQAGSSFHYPDANGDGFRRAVMISQGEVKTGKPHQQALLKKWWAVKRARYATIVESLTDEKMEALLRGLMEGEFYKAPSPHPNATNLLEGLLIQEPSLVEHILKLTNHKSHPIYLPPEEIERVRGFLDQLQSITGNENANAEERLSFFLDVIKSSVAIGDRVISEGAPLKLPSDILKRSDHRMTVTLLGRKLPNFMVRIGGQQHSSDQIEQIWSGKAKDWHLGVLRMSIFDYFVKLRKLYALKSNPDTVAAFYEKFITKVDALYDEERRVIEGLNKYGPEYDRRFLQSSLKDFCTLVSPGALDEKNLNGEHLVNVFNLIPSEAEFSGVKVYDLYEELNRMSRYLFIGEEYRVPSDSVPPVPETLKLKRQKGASHPKLNKMISQAQKELQQVVLKAGTPAYQRLFDRLRREARSRYKTYFQREKEAVRKRIPAPPVLKVPVYDNVNTAGFGDQINAESIKRMRSRGQSVINTRKEDNFHEDLFWDMMVYYFRVCDESWTNSEDREYNDATLRQYILHNFDNFWAWYRHKLEQTEE